MVITSNIMAMNAQRQYNIVGNNKKKSLEKLSSGYKINRAADDAAGLAISEKMRRQIRGLTQGVKNTQDGVSMCQIADGALDEVSAMLHRITELSVKSANDTNTPEDRQAIQSEINAILKEIDRISDTVTFNNQRIFSKPTPSEEELSSSPFGQAKKALMDGTYQTVNADVVLKDGSTISQADANAMIRMLSNIAIIGKGYEIYEDSSKNYPSGYKYIMDEVKDHIILNRDTIRNNTHPLYSYGESATYTDSMNYAESNLVEALTKYKAMITLLTL